MVGFTGTTIPDSIRIDLQQRGLGGVILFGGNIVSKTQVATLTSELSSLSTSQLLLAIDQEGGRVARLGPSNGFAVSPSAYYVGTTVNREDTARKWGAIMAEWVRQAGFNINFAPVADLNVNPKSPAIGKLDRSYSSNTDTVFRHIGWFIDEFHKKKIITTLKHFPGHGSAATDSHLGFTDVSGTWTPKELIPFQSAVASGAADIIMAGHLFNAVIDSQHPASLSHKTITRLLRDSLGFGGVVVSDELFMNAIAANYAFDDALELCVLSGTDILLFVKSIYNNRSLTSYVVDVISRKVKEGKITASVIDSAYERIQRLKQRILTNVSFASNALPQHLHLEQNYPNPFNPSTTLRFSVSSAGIATVSVFDMLGREVAVLFNSEARSGRPYTVTFSGGNLPSGTYIARLRTPGSSASVKMLLIK